MAKVTETQKAAYQQSLAKERSNAAQARQLSDILSPIEQQLISSPVGKRLARGEAVNADELDQQTRMAIGAQSGQQVSIKRNVLQTLAQLQQEVARQQGQINPINSLADVVNAPASQGAVVAQSTPVTDPIQTVKNIIARRTQPIRNQIMDIINPLRQPTDVIPTEQLQSGDLSLLQRLLNPEGQQRTGQQIIDALKSLIPAAQPATIETELMKKLTAKSPELAANAKAKGLKRFAGSGEVKLGGSTYKVDESGRIIKIR